MTRFLILSAVMFLVTWLSLGSLAFADEGAQPDEQKPDEQAVSYWSDVRPVLQAHCQGCHQPAKSGGEYVMTEFESMVRGGESGEPAIVPGDLEASYLIGQIRPLDGEAAMPQGKPPLSATEIGLLERWISAGAKDDTPASARQRYDADHPPQYSAAPVITALRFSPDGETLAVSGYHEVLLHDVGKIVAGEDSLKARLIGLSERIESVAYSPDGTMLAVAGGSPGRLGEIQLWNVDDAQLKYSVPVSYDTCYGVSWSPDGKLIGCGCPDNTVRAFNSETGEQVLFNGAHSDWVLDTVFSLKSTHIVTVSRDRSMKLIEVGTERFVDNISSITPGALKGGLHAVERHPTADQLLIGGSDGTPKIYRMFREKARKIGDDFNLLRKFPEMPGRIFDVQFSTDAERVVAGSSYNGAGHVHLYSVKDGKELAQMKGITSAVFAVALSPDGKYLVSGGFDGSVYLHEAESGELQRSFVPVTIADTPVAQATGVSADATSQDQ